MTSSLTSIAMARTLAVAVSCAGLGLGGTTLSAQDAKADSDPALDDTSIPEAITQSSAPSSGQSFDPAYFAQYSPRTALDMIEQVPGFQVSGGGGGGRGLGQANQNVLVNGERLSSKSDSAQDQLRRIPADDVVRIDIVDGTSLDVPGLTGQVANVIVELEGISGNFDWKGRYRSTTPGPEWYGGEISVAGVTGDLTFTLALDNPNNRFGSDGPTTITDADGALLEVEETRFRGKFDKPTLTANLGYDFSEDVSGTLNLSYARSYFRRERDEATSGPLIDPSLRSNRTREDGYEYEISGDITFPLGAGDLKLIGVERYDQEDFTETVIEVFDNPLLDNEGSKFTRLDGIGERIGRAEYDFPLIGIEWQLAGEAAFNRLDRASGLFELDTDEEFAEIDFPEGTGGVNEDRYDFSLSISKALTNKLSLQATAGYEASTISQTGSAANSRTFSRPKGSASLAWSNGKGLDITLTGERRIGQLSFGDFLAGVFLENENTNAGNNDLSASQTWEAELEINKTLGPWGSTKLIIEQRWIEDFIDLIPTGDGSDTRGNIDNARRTEIEWASTFKFEPIGIPGAQLDLRLEYEEGEVRDPLTGLLRDFARGSDREADVEFRHDIPNSDFAYGAGLNYERNRASFRIDEISLSKDGPTFARVFVEHKDLFGLTTRATLGNLVGGRDGFERTVYDGERNSSAVLFNEERSGRIGTIFRLAISGNF